MSCHWLRPRLGARTAGCRVRRRGRGLAGLWAAILTMAGTSKDPGGMITGIRFMPPKFYVIGSGAYEPPRRAEVSGVVYAGGGGGGGGGDGGGVTISGC